MRLYEPAAMKAHLRLKNTLHPISIQFFNRLSYGSTWWWCRSIPFVCAVVWSYTSIQGSKFESTFWFQIIMSLFICHKKTFRCGSFQTRNCNATPHCLLIYTKDGIYPSGMTYKTPVLFWLPVTNLRTVSYENALNPMGSSPHILTLAKHPIILYMHIITKTN
jgi:hypothetical protein